MTYTPINDQTADLQTVSSLILKLLIQALQGINVPEGISDILASKLMGLGRRYTGNDQLWDTVVSSNMTATGIYMQQQKNMIGYLSGTVASQYSDVWMRQTLANWERTKTTYSDWIKLEGNENKTQEDYNKYIDQQVQGLVNKPYFRTIYNMASSYLGFGDSEEAARYMGMAAANIARIGVRRGDPNAIMFSHELTSNLFTGEYDEQTKQYAPKDFNKKDWHGFSRAAVAGMSAFVSKDIDFLKDVDPTQLNELDTAVQRFRDFTKQFLYALEPLKDIFGNNVSQMVNLIQSMTGQSLGQMSISQVRALSTNIADRTLLGAYDINGESGLLATSQVLSKLISQTEGLAPFNRISVPTQAMAAMDMAAGGGARAPNMTESAWRSEATNWVYQTYNSPAADLVAKAYALWAEQKVPWYERTEENPAPTVADFIEEIEEHGGDFRQAAMDLAGVQDPYTLNAGMSSPYYNMAIQSGIGGEVTAYFTDTMYRNTVKSALKTDPGFIKAAGLGNSPEALEEIGNAYDEVMSIIEDTPEMYTLATTNPQEFWTRMNENKGRYEDLLGVEITEDKMHLYGNMIRYIQGDTHLSKYMNKSLFMMNQRQMEENAFKVKLRRDRLSDVNAAVFESGSGFMDLLDDGFTNEKLRQKLVDSQLISAQGEDPSEVYAWLNLIGNQTKSLFAIPKGATDEEKKIITDRANKFGQQVYEYINSPEGTYNKHLVHAFGEYKKLMDKQQANPNMSPEESKELKEKAQYYQDVVTLYTYANDEAVDRLITSDVYDEKGNKLEGEEAERARAKQIRSMVENTKQLPSRMLPAEIRKQALDTQINALDKTDEASQRLLDIHKDFTSKQVDLNHDDIIDVAEGWKDYYKDRLKDKNITQEEKEALEKYDAMLNTAQSGTGPGGHRGDMSNLLLDVLQKLLNWLQAHEDIPNTSNEKPWADNDSKRK